MISKILDVLHAEFSDPAVQRGIIVAIAMLALKFGLKYGMDQAHADTLATGVWSFFTVAVSRAQGKQ